MLFAALATVHGQIRYTATALGSLGGTITYPTALNNFGEVVGYSYLADNQNYHAFKYSNGTMTDLGTFGGSRSQAWDINENGTAVGWADGLTTTTPFTHSGSQMNAVPITGSVYSYAYSINNAGTIAGVALVPGSFQVFTFASGVTTYLGEAGETNAVVHINSAGTVAATMSPQGAVKVAGSAPINLGSLGGHSGTYTYDINDLEVIVGMSYTPTGFAHAFAHAHGKMSDLGTLQGGNASSANGINNNGVIVGATYVDGNSAVRAFVYTEQMMSDLNSLVGLPPGTILTHATGINDSGQIIASAYGGGAYLLTPIPEPAVSAAGVAVMTLLGTFMLRRRRQGVNTPPMSG